MKKRDKVVVAGNTKIRLKGLKAVKDYYANEILPKIPNPISQTQVRWALKTGSLQADSEKPWEIDSTNLHPIDPDERRRLRECDCYGHGELSGKLNCCEKTARTLVKKVRACDWFFGRRLFNSSSYAPYKKKGPPRS
jgi:hypothetical protein